MILSSNILGVSWREHGTNKSVLEKLGLESELLTNVAKFKLQYFGHMLRGSAVCRFLKECWMSVEDVHNYVLE